MGKDLVLSLQQLGSLLWCGFDLWPWDFLRLQVWPKKKKRKEKKSERERERERSFHMEWKLGEKSKMMIQNSQILLKRKARRNLHKKVLELSFMK